jgi:D-alanyl-D-alanine carboxypeptidase (penicillin-binding protein 5/6)
MDVAMARARADGAPQRTTRRALAAAVTAAAALAPGGLAPRVAAATPVAVAANAAPGPVVAAPSAVLVDALSGRVLFARGADIVRPPASMAKIMTLVLAVQALREGRVRPEDLVAASDEAYRTGGAQIWLEPGEVLPFGQLVTAVAVGSANDAAVAIAEHLAGSVPAFVAEMNAMARRLGMRHTRFANPNGLDSAGSETRTTAADMARLGVYAAGMPEVLRLTAQREDRSIRDGKGGRLWLVNTNRLLGRVPGVDGLKTGYTSQAGWCLTATAARDGLRLVAVVMGAPSSKQRFADAAALLNWGFAHRRAVVVAQAGRPLARVAVRGGRVARVAVGSARDVAFSVAAGESSRYHRSLELPASVAAPLARGAVVGWMTVVVDGERRRVPLVALRAVGRARPLDILRRLVGGGRRVALSA